VIADSAAGIPPARERITATLFLAVLAHLVLILGITFGLGAGSFAPLQSLEVRLVPEAGDEPRSGDAAYLAEFDRVGRGTTTERIRALTPRGLEPRPAEDAVDATGRRQPEGLPDRIAVLGRAVPHITILYSGAPTNAPLEIGRQAAQREQLAHRDPQIESGGDDRVDRAALTGPASKEGELVSPDTRAAAFAPYLDRWRRKVERFGTLNFPATTPADARAPVLEIVLRADGRVREVTVRRSSGVMAIDQAAVQIVRNAGPFEVFDETLARVSPELRFAYEWRFESGARDASERAP
jgi:protein TonB